ncbi:MAG: hypothetical protein AAGM22_05025 [Acidobacteriota bacterium]
MNFDTRQLSVSLSTLIGVEDGLCPLETKPFSELDGCPLETRPFDLAGACPLETKPFTAPEDLSAAAACPLETKPFVSAEVEAVALI